MKKAIAIIMLLALCFAAFANGATETAPAAATPVAKEETLVGKYPVKTLNMIVPYGAGGDTDIYARLVAERLEKLLGIKVVVNNMKGGTATVAGNYVLNAAPDGATVLWTHTANLIQMINGVAKYNIIEDFEYAGTVVADRSNTLVVMKKSPFQNLDDIIKHLKANPSSVKVSPQVQPMNFELEDKLGVTFNRVDVGSNASERVVALLNGQIEALISNYVSIADYVESGDMRVLAMVSNTYTPNNKTFADYGYDITDAKYYEMRYPKGTAKETIELMEKALKIVSEDPTFKEQLNKFYSEVCYRNAADSYQFDKQLAAYMSTLNGGNLQ